MMAQSSALARTPHEYAVAVTIRPLYSHEDYAACVQLQRDTWGEHYADIVPASVLKVSQNVGGVSVGAFTREGRLVGFVYGLTGMRDGRLMHWSHMLAVHPDHRNQGVGRCLKEYQREVLRGSGIEMMYWTFDPLVARNAHLNINRLGTRVCEYVADMYGDTGSELHAFGTDRLVVCWPVSPDVRAEPVGLPEAWRAAPLANGLVAGIAGDTGIEMADSSGERNARVRRIEIPVDVEQMDVAEARAWRGSTRQVFQSLIAAGYNVSAFFKEEGARCFYVLTNGERRGPGC